MSQPAQLAIDTLHAARRWVAARLVLRRVLDSKTATPKKVEQAKVDYNKTAEELENAVVKLERVLQGGGKLPLKKGGAPFPWREFFGMVSMGAQAVHSALEPETPSVKATVVSSKAVGKIIDAESE